MDFNPDNDRINDSIIDHIKTCFSCALHHYKNNVAGIIEGIGAIVPYSFRDHTKYRHWCKHSKDQKGEKPFMLDDVATKLAPLGLTSIALWEQRTQRNDFTEDQRVVTTVCQQQLPSSMKDMNI
ncbi:unnamed protein product [Porites lobata]|uniref:Uncharacterized protein n=1 Tax=Porites lobata TaxID=104759 RepID=A0ABN8R0C1_9CNID|nr:unnamed protein product [Porites lobata]